MRLTFLGTSAGMPTTERNVTALALAIDDARQWYLVDCGEGTQHQLLRCRYTLNNLKTIFITHVHGDHMYGLPGLISSASMQGRQASMTICAPDGVQQFVEAALHYAGVSELPFSIEFIRTDQPAFKYQDSQVAVTAHQLSHRVPSFAYRFVEKTVSTQLNIAQLNALGVPRGELWGRLQKGQTVTLEDGRQILPEQVLQPPPASRIAIIAGDNDQPELLIDALQGSHLLVHEATLTDAALQKVGPVWMHSSARMVAEAAEASGIPNLILTHFSGRYQPFPSTGPNSVSAIKAEAEDYYSGNVGLASDLSIWALNRSGQLIPLQP
ncbi:ribonuclease Z [Endozoicomonas sp. SCSIO W0465]|uniref:ribonuclease Z n=1 Tax=Endozoicomonas sp. SCSIO W0465 TaxID=2918516 RepID=UPI002074CB0F|nr:ribonuclease Z [Endozoicomonas sp. SCSIO W0465]USE37024.1 ribonuclease Z [Endozoicomonas sp. SCSIO W0465]